MLYGDCCYDYEYHCVEGYVNDCTGTSTLDTSGGDEIIDLLDLLPSTGIFPPGPSEKIDENPQYPTRVQGPGPTRLSDLGPTRGQPQDPIVTQDTSTSESVLTIEDKVSTTLASAGNLFYKCNDSVNTDYVSPLESEEYWMKVMSRNVSELSGLNCMYQSQFSNSYLLHDKCTVDTPTSHLCNQSSSSSDPLSFVPVLGSDNVHYKNAYCALCSGLTYSDLQYWNLTLHNCVNLTESDDGNFATLNEKCKIKVSFDSTNTKKPRECIRSLTKCSTKIKDTLIDACRKYSAPVTINGTLYKNPHCAECSGFNTSAIDLCILPDTGGGEFPKWDYEGDFSAARPPPGSSGSGLAGPSFSIFFDFGGGNAHYTGIDGQLTSINFPSCEEGTTFDPFSGQCRQLSCPIGYEFIGDRCKALPKSSDYNYSTVRYFKMDFVLQHANVSDSEVFSEQMLEILRNNVSVTHFNTVFHSDLEISNTALSVQETCAGVGISNLRIMCEGNETEETPFDQVKEILNTLIKPYMTGCNTFNGSNSKGLLLEFTIGNHDQSEICKGPNAVAALVNSTEFETEKHRSISDGVDATNATSFGIHEIFHSVRYSRHSEHSSWVITETNHICKSKLTCELVTLNSSEFTWLSEQRDTFRHIESDVEVTIDDFIEISDKHVQVCSKTFNSFFRSSGRLFYAKSRGQELLVTIGISFSTVFLVVVLVTYLTFPELRNIPGKIVLSLSLALLVAQLMFLLGVDKTANKAICLTLTLLMHFTWLAVFFWTNVLSFDLACTFGGNFGKKRSESMTRFLKYSLYAWGTPALVVSISTVVHFTTSIDGSTENVYDAKSSCWLRLGLSTLFGYCIPMLCILLGNFCLFVYTIWGIQRTRSATKMVQKDKDKTTQKQKDLTLSIRVSGTRV